MGEEILKKILKKYNLLEVHKDTYSYVSENDIVKMVKKIEDKLMPCNDVYNHLNSSPFIKSIKVKPIKSIDKEKFILHIEIETVSARIYIIPLNYNTGEILVLCSIEEQIITLYDVENKKPLNIDNYMNAFEEQIKEIMKNSNVNLDDLYNKYKKEHLLKNKEKDKKAENLYREVGELLRTINKRMSKTKRLKIIEEVERKFNYIINNYPQFPGLTGCYTNLGQLKIDRKMYENMKEKNIITNLLLDDKTYCEAGELFEKALEINPTNYVAIEKYAILHFQQENYDKCLEYINKLEKDRVRNIIGFISNMGFALINVSEKRIEFYEEIYKCYPESLELMYILGKLYTYENDKSLKAYSFYKKCINQNPKSIIKIGTDMAYICMLLEKYKEQEEYCKKILRTLSNVNDITTREFEEVKYNSLSLLASSYIEQGNYKESLSIRQELVDKFPNNTTYHNLGNTLYQMKNYDDAIEYLKKALEIYEDQTTNKLLGDIYFEKNDFSEAIKYYIKSLEFLKNIDLNKIRKDKDIKNRINLVKSDLYNNIVNSYINIKDYLNAMKYNNQALKEFSNDYKFKSLDEKLKCIANN